MRNSCERDRTCESHRFFFSYDILQYVIYNRRKNWLIYILYNDINVSMHSRLWTSRFMNLMNKIQKIAHSLVGTLPRERKKNNKNINTKHKPNL